MKNLEELYGDISKDKDQWCYYPESNLNIANVWNDEDNSYSFIISYFSYAEKIRLFEDVVNKDNIDLLKERSKHIVSTFLLSLIITKAFKISFCYEDDFFNNKYYLFLACLYHDVGYIYEKKNINEFNIDNMEKFGFIELEKILEIKNRSHNIFKTYSSEDVEIYLRGRLNEYNVIDHGIAGELLLYDRLIKQFNKMFQCRTKIDDKKSDFYYKNKHGRLLHLSRKHHLSYERVADAIIAHNIWVDTLQKYKGNKNKSFKNILKSNTLCYVLSIADTIEPLKKGINLSDIYIKYRNDEIILKVNSKCDNSFYQNVQGLEEWIDVQVSITKHKNFNQISIKSIDG